MDDCRRRRGCHRFNGTFNDTVHRLGNKGGGIVEERDRQDTGCNGGHEVYQNREENELGFGEFLYVHTTIMLPVTAVVNKFNCPCECLCETI